MVLLLYAEVRWLSRGKILNRPFVLRKEIKLFFQQQNNQKFQKLSSDDEWVAKVAYLTDVFSLSLHGQLKDVFLQNKVNAFRKKLSLWQTHLTEGDLQKFTNFDEYMGEKDLNRQVVSIIQQHLQSLTKYFNFFYSSEEDPRPGNIWIIDPFLANIEESKSSINEKESLIDLYCNDSLKVKFQSSLSRPYFWLSVKNEYPSQSEKAMKILIQFSTTYLCEKIFSSVTVIKTRYRSRLEIDAALRLAVTSLEWNLYILMSNKQEQPSH